MNHSHQEKRSLLRMREERPQAVEAEKNRCLIFVCNVAMLTLVKGRESCTVCQSTILFQCSMQLSESQPFSTTNYGD